MPNLYSSARLYTQAKRKRSMLVTANIAFSNFCNSNKYHDTFPDWSLLLKLWPSPGDVEAACKVGPGSNTLSLDHDMENNSVSHDSDEDFWEDAILDEDMLFSDSSASSGDADDAANDNDNDAEDELFPLRLLL